ncbi:bifunctional hydroxymethylpyrimidine kinase/phosphomethylpyrimidine kinase [Paenarthrobacter sp. PH39-S1]|uniref:bifunctional hydroxymethylpyrimidine kinase/phosphomethylpyrimidine kinase n=1 Tax=Paenarthrobacter sp. PH39-S1 TaxID=3046204 RepID=UPI0024BA93BA|nr:bifunctional hydroxymethylpyrimidine kinase/phosphomethylpyrimidine kinase [Paenarthrobacter sp. PH39-S1]MDJ0355398.1 bifunctional hydroxymethylpyrimidine kinase/phosphomethylpyrimidine kinase [Paenarthrobacter sp. PH39-S1]
MRSNQQNNQQASQQHRSPDPRPALNRVPRVLSIAGSDPSGGAGIQADLKSIAANGGYGMAAITALTAQNTRGVRSVHVPPVGFLKEQLDAVTEDIEIDAVKIGMLGDADVIDTVARWLTRTRPSVVVLDPVMVASSGDRLLPANAEHALRELLRQADLITPNLPELAVLVDEPPARSWDDALAQGKRLAAGSDVRVLVKGGHLDSQDCPDALVSPDGSVHQFSASRVRTRNTHGTGCSLSAGLATVQAQLGDWPASLQRVKAWLQGALEHADELQVGGGHGPVNHFQSLWAHRPPADGDFSGQLWQEIAGVRRDIFGLDFIRALGNGSLHRRHFEYYLAQDALYLNGYSRVLARASALAPTEEEQLFWANSSRQCLLVETELHRNWLGGQLADATPGPVTKAYLDHLLAASAGGSYAELVAALLPCYWLYADVGATLHAQFRADQPADDGEHPYAAWLSTYADEDFAAATRRAISITDQAARNGSTGERERMRQAFGGSARLELAFFDAPRLYSQ